jgi:hypothetical protein
MGNGMYQFLANALCLPASRTLGAYSSPDRSADDGIMWESLKINTEIFESLHGKSVPTKDFRRLVTIGFDSVKIKAKVTHDPHTGAIIGYADEDWNNIDGIKAALAGITADEAEAKEPEKAEHYFVFYATTWDRNSKPIRFIVARYGVHGLSWQYLRDRMLEIISALKLKGFIVTTISGDGASENRALFLNLATLTVRDLIEMKVRACS